MYSLTLLLLELGLLLNGVGCDVVSNVTIEEGSTLMLPCETAYPEWSVTDNGWIFQVSFCYSYNCYNMLPLEYFARLPKKNVYNSQWPYLRVLNASKFLTQIQCGSYIWKFNVIDSVPQNIVLRANGISKYVRVQSGSDVALICSKLTGYGIRLSLTRDNPISVLVSYSYSFEIAYTMYILPSYPPYFSVECAIDNDKIRILVEVADELSDTVSTTSKNEAMEVTTFRWTTFAFPTIPSYDDISTVTIVVSVSVFGFAILLIVVVIIITRYRRARRKRQSRDTTLQPATPQLDNTAVGQRRSWAALQLNTTTVSEPPVYEECVHIFTIARVELDAAAEPRPPAYDSLPPSYEEAILFEVKRTAH
ncbi:hypothetical protein Bpfe_009213 [Biomphalaria pfeifferi]|uniref:Uncharacterized protein n=1 Tax=Biomphalaria pfeifferi TaxID=112525 RepID=A0AAD8BV33_BIOPF|nr:hypothetical protein Bpfe_009213 [Biomphalaria pfeifferi]